MFDGMWLMCNVVWTALIGVLAADGSLKSAGVSFWGWVMRCVCRGGTLVCVCVEGGTSGVGGAGSGRHGFSGCS